MILRDGSVRDIQFVTRSGSAAFDLNAQGAVEAAGNSQAFGVLPEGWNADVLPISMVFDDEHAEARRQAARPAREAEERVRSARAAQARKAEERARATAASQRMRARISRINSRTWPTDIKEAVIDRRVMIGMTGEMVRESWGAPTGVNTRVTAEGRLEQWVYGDDYVYLQDGVVTSIETSR